jgi:protein-S-isoprenylcysteine O-methyltransferase Ste14
MQAVHLPNPTEAQAVMLTTYVIYVTVSLAITFWVGRTLNRNGRVFLVENFAGREALADSINHLLLVGFYLINIGFISLALRFGDRPTDIVGAVELLSTKIGLAVVVLGGLHFFNMFALVRFRNWPMFDRFAKRASAQPDESGLPVAARSV